MTAASRAQPAAPARSRRILAIDYGRRRIGLALSDELLLTARPLATLTRKNRRDDLRRLRGVIREHGVARLIIGHPLMLNGSAGPMADEAAAFAARLKKELRLPVELVDERLTSWEAEQLLADREASKRQGRETLDQTAAAVLLRDYLSRQAGAPATGI